MRVKKRSNDPKRSKEEISKEKRGLIKSIKDLDRQIRKYETANNARDYSKDKKYVDMTGRKSRFEEALKSL